MNRGKLTFFVILFFCLTANVYASEKIRVAGSGSMIPLLTELARVYMAEHRHVTIAVNQASLQSAGGIMGTSKGELEIGMANRDLKGEEAALGLEMIEIARAAVVIGVNRNVPLKDISSDNLCKIYDGTLRNWSELGAGDGKILAVTKSEKDATKETVRKSIPCFKNLKESESVVLVPTSPEITKVLSNSRAIGFTSMVDVDASKGAITPLRLDDVAPSAENVRSGKYKVSQTFHLVTKGKLAGAAKDFIDFIKGAKGKKIIEASKAIPLK